MSKRSKISKKGKDVRVHNYEDAIEEPHLTAHRTIKLFVDELDTIAGQVEQFACSILGDNCKACAEREFYVRPHNSSLQLGPIEESLFRSWFVYLWSPLCNPAYVGSEIAHQLEERGESVMILGSLAEIWRLLAEPKLSSRCEDLLDEIATHILRYYLIEEIGDDLEITLRDIISGNQVQVLAPHLADSNCTGSMIFGQIVTFQNYNLIACAGPLLLPGELAQDILQFHQTIVQAISSHPSLQSQLKEPGMADALALFHGASYYRDLYFRAAHHFSQDVDSEDNDASKNTSPILLH